MWFSIIEWEVEPTVVVVSCTTKLLTIKDLCCSLAIFQMNFGAYFFLYKGMMVLRAFNLLDKERLDSEGKAWNVVPVPVRLTCFMWGEH